MFVATLPCQSGNCVFFAWWRVRRFGLQLYHAKAETRALRFELNSFFGCNFTMPKRKLLILPVPRASVTVATLPCQSGNSHRELPVWHSTPLQLYHAKAETGLCDGVSICPPQLQLYHAKAETLNTGGVSRVCYRCCNFTMPKRKRRSGINRGGAFLRLQLYHAKAETHHKASVPFPTGLSCNFTMPKRKRCVVREIRRSRQRLQLYHAKAETVAILLLQGRRYRLQLYHAKAETPVRHLMRIIMTMLQLYHAKAETYPSNCVSKQTTIVATLPCQSGNKVRLAYLADVARGCNFTMPKRKQ